MKNVNVRGFANCPDLAFRLASKGIDISKMEMIGAISDDKLLNIWHVGEQIVIRHSNIKAVIRTDGKNSYRLIDKITGTHLPDSKERIKNDKDFLDLMMGKHFEYELDLESTSSWYAAIYITEEDETITTDFSMYLDIMPIEDVIEKVYHKYDMSEYRKTYQ